MSNDKSARRLKLEAELRENLKRRKEQARGRRDREAAPDSDPGHDAPAPPDTPSEA
ncbi:hypothetical protein [Antarcticirhabdus aurantiaca]|uniref:Uncharacterized protein n=1 Tax=Antarcticirhabdus aurantiaca TaxID=2606717 RepID=A0ACD4NTM2_9HYPH|nr:hypothetical protein [Antarcticirhabdus aurantiaca]WAJ30385.1 hypothetical protein OXU80_09355 [Jeongeuplla avenae]